MKQDLLRKTQLDIFENYLSISKNEGLDKLPDGWKWKKLGEIIKTVEGDRGSNYPKKNEFSDNDFCLFLSTKNVRKDRFVFDENIFISKEKDKILRSGKLQLNDVVITTRGTLGNVAVYDEKVNYKNVRINSGMLILRDFQHILNSYFLAKFIISPLFTQQLKDKQSGSAQPQIPANVLKELLIPIPPLQEQKRLVEKLDFIFEKLQKTLHLQKQKLEILKALELSILNSAFKGEL